MANRLQILQRLELSRVVFGLLGQNLTNERLDLLAGDVDFRGISKGRVYGEC